MESKFNDKISERLVQLIIRWKEQTDTVEEYLIDYSNGFNISKSQISKDVSKMKRTFREIEVILKEL